VAGNYVRSEDGSNRQAIIRSSKDALTFCCPLIFSSSLKGRNKRRTVSIEIRKIHRFLARVNGIGEQRRREAER
jgi:hypothetical protein